jgi:hypothetical protein
MVIGCNQDEGLTPVKKIVRIGLPDLNGIVVT